MRQPPPFRLSCPAIKSITSIAIATALGAIVYGCAPQNQQTLPPPMAISTTHEVGRPQVTVAPWYGPGFHGHPTSSGEIYNQQALTAASRTLPLGSHARVTNLKTGKSVLVRINDCGPFVRGGGLEPARAAAHLLGIDHRGTARVRVTRIDGPSGEVGHSWAGTVKMRDMVPVAPVDYASTTNQPVTESGMVANPFASWFME